MNQGLLLKFLLITLPDAVLGKASMSMSFSTLNKGLSFSLMIFLA